MGEDNLKSLHKWKNYEILLKNHHIIVYPRVSKNDAPNSETVSELKNHENISLIDAPIIELSATEIRNMIKDNKNVRPMLPPEVFEYLDGSNFYRD
jgi:nicotinate-nucleotide adenylyltransferase